MSTNHQGGNVYDNYNIKIKRKDGFTLQIVPNVSINTAYRILPWLIEDLLVRGEADDPAAGNDRKNTRDATRDWFTVHDQTWFKRIADSGYTSIWGLDIFMEHS